MIGRRRLFSTDAFNAARHYFYYINVHGHLYSIMRPDLSSLPTGPTFLRDAKQLHFFFKRLRRNDTGLFADQFPFVSPCGKELNFVACADRPVVFQDLVRDRDKKSARLTFATARVTQTDYLAVDFDPARVFVGRSNGRLYFDPREPLPGGGVGLIRSQLCFELGQRIEFHDNGNVDLLFDDVVYRLPFIETNSH